MSGKIIVANADDTDRGANSAGESTIVAAPTLSSLDSTCGFAPASNYIKDDKGPSDLDGDFGITDKCPTRSLCGSDNTLTQCLDNAHCYADRNMRVEHGSNPDLTLMRQWIALEQERSNMAKAMLKLHADDVDSVDAKLGSGKAFFKAMLYESISKGSMYISMMHEYIKDEDSSSNDSENIVDENCRDDLEPNRLLWLLYGGIGFAIGLVIMALLCMCYHANKKAPVGQVGHQKSRDLLPETTQTMVLTRPVMMRAPSNPVSPPLMGHSMPPMAPLYNTMPAQANYPPQHAPPPQGHPVPSAPYTVKVLRHLYHEFDVNVPIQHQLSAGNLQKNQGTHIGLELSERAPWVVKAVDDLMDRNRRMQGEPGYLNEPVTAGDKLMAINGVQVSHLGIRQIHEMMKGEQYTPVRISLARANSGQPYDVNVIRHMAHEFDVPIKVSSANQATHIGLEISDSAPYTVMKVDDLMDRNRRTQDEPGYENEQIQKGDMLIAVNGKQVDNLSIADIHNMLRGDRHTLVELTLIRASGGPPPNETGYGQPGPYDGRTSSAPGPLSPQDYAQFPDGMPNHPQVDAQLMFMPQNQPHQVGQHPPQPLQPMYGTPQIPPRNQYPVTSGHGQFAPPARPGPPLAGYSGQGFA